MVSTKKTALITGGTRGIGLGIAKQLATDGFDLALNGQREEPEVVQVMQELNALGAKTIYCRGNIAVAEDRQRIIDQIKNQFGHLNVLVNNAGIAPRQRADLLGMTEASFDEVLSINLKGAFFLSQQISRWMIEQKSKDKDFTACLINISSMSATVASINRGEYCIAKAGLAMVTQLFAVKLGVYDIPVYEVRPGIIATDMTAGVKEKYDKLIAEGITVQPRWGFPEDVGKAVGALAAAQFPFSTGQVIMVDGGLTLQRL